MSQLSTKKEELERKISDLEATLHDLKRQVQEQIETEQHDAIEHLEDYLEQIDHKYANLREFLVTVFNEIRDLLHGKSDKDDGILKP